MQVKFFKKEKSFKKEKESLWLNINFYWKLAVGFMLVTFLISLAFGCYLFLKINKEFVLAEGAVSSQVETVSLERIKGVLEYFSGREKKSKEIINSPAPVFDPSL
ncbi:MAG: hypothetical protein V4699_03310 [Patescibacteria group bacterium]